MAASALRAIEILPLRWPRRQSIDRRLHRFILVFAQMPRRRRRRSVNRAVAEPQKPRLCLVTTFALDVIAGPLGVVVGRIAADRLLLAIALDDLVAVIDASVLRVLGPVPDNLVIPVAAIAGVRACVPLADLSRLITI